MPPHRLQAPRDDGGVLAVPPLAEVGALLQTNRQRLQSATVDFHGRSFHELRTLASQEARAAARQFMASLGLPVPEEWSHFGSLIMTGHQPELFHPGVWIKNFAIHGLAKAHGLTPLNLIVDNDVVKTTSIRVPVRASGRVQTRAIPFNRWAGSAPYEELMVRDEDSFAQFPPKVTAVFSDWGLEPILPRFWQGALQLADRTRLLGERLAGARRLWEETWNCHNLELPLSWLCRTEAFAWFTCHLLAELPRFHSIYNDCLHSYRQRHSIRRKNHPVPDLTVQDDWLEAPLWVWREGEALRDRLFVRRTGQDIECRRQNDRLARLPLTSGHAMVESWRQLEVQGLKVRTRALTTTLFARLFLADLFVHGLGGAVYDQVTDAIMRAFYSMEPPGYLILSGTLRLPLERSKSGGLRPPLAEAQIRQQVRELWYNPDRYCHDLEARDARVAELCRQKREWIARRPEQPEAKRQRFQMIHEINEQLRPYVQEQRDFWERQLAEAEEQHAAARILQDREYAFCLYPEAKLRPFCQQFCEVPRPRT